jgi:hypothetical protein
VNEIIAFLDSLKLCNQDYVEMVGETFRYQLVKRGGRDVHWDCYKFDKHILSLEQKSAQRILNIERHLRDAVL